MSKKYFIGKGVRQGCILSPCLFNFYAEYIMRKTGLEETQAGIKIDGRNIGNLRYADDTLTCLSWEPHPTWGVLPSAPQRPAAHTPARSTSKVGARPPQASPPTRPTTGSQQIHVPLPSASRGPHAAGSPLCNNARIFTDLPLSSRTRAPDHLPSILLRPSLSAAETHAVSAGEGEPPYHLLGPSPPCWCLGTLKRHLPGSLLPGLGVGSTCLQPQGFRAG